MNEQPRTGFLLYLKIGRFPLRNAPELFPL